MAIFTGAGVAIVTPFNDDEERSINYDKLDALLDYHCNNGTDCNLWNNWRVCNNDRRRTYAVRKVCN